jgi:hypothetical protein
VSRTDEQSRDAEALCDRDGQWLRTIRRHGYPVLPSASSEPLVYHAANELDSHAGACVRPQPVFARGRAGAPLSSWSDKLPWSTATLSKFAVKRIPCSALTRLMAARSAPEQAALVSELSGGLGLAGSVNANENMCVAHGHGSVWPRLGARRPKNRAAGGTRRHRHAAGIIGLEGGAVGTAALWRAVLLAIAGLVLLRRLRPGPSPKPGRRGSPSCYNLF